MRDLEKAKEILLSDGYTCVLCKGDKEYASSLRGVRPLLELLDAQSNFSGASAADKTVGAGAAHLYVLLGTKRVWARIMSESGKRILEKNGIEALCEQTVPFIINRAGDGMCPIENAVKDVASPIEALSKIRETLASLAK